MGKTDSGALSAPNIIEYPFKRTTGPVVGAFYTGLREQVLVGIRTPEGRVLCPPIENDPVTGADLTEVVEVGPGGEVTTWAWNSDPQEFQPLDRPFAWALIRLDGADTALLHAVDTGDAGPSAMRTGMRVVARFRDERKGELADLECFVPEGGAA